MYNKGKGRARFTRDAIEKVTELTKAMFFKYINPTNLRRLQKTLDLSDVEGEKPCINRVMIPIAERIDEEERQRELREEAEWRKRIKGWPSSMIYDCMGEDDYLIDEEEGVILNAKHLKRLNKKYYNGKSEKSSKRGKRGKGKKKNELVYSTYDDDYWKNRKTMFKNGEWSDDDEDNYEDAYKSIKFYPDITNEMSAIEFNSLKEFSDYCDEHGYAVGTTDYDNLKNWGVIHCCLDPIDLEYGEFAIVTDSSYGGLYWTVEKDLPDDVKYPEVAGSGVEARTLTD